MKARWFYKHINPYCKRKREERKGIGYLAHSGSLTDAASMHRLARRSTGSNLGPASESGFFHNSKLICCDFRETQGVRFQKADSV